MAAAQPTNGNERYDLVSCYAGLPPILVERGDKGRQNNGDNHPIMSNERMWSTKTGIIRVEVVTPERRRPTYEQMIRREVIELLMVYPECLGDSGKLEERLVEAGDTASAKEIIAGIYGIPEHILDHVKGTLDDYARLEPPKQKWGINEKGHAATFPRHPSPTMRFELQENSC